MKELIKETENMRAKLLEVMLNIPYDFEPNYTIAITQVADFLKKLIERKDNIVDLSEIWKDGNKEKPIPYSPIVVKDCCIVSGNDDDVDDSQWAYLEDLLPKGGD